MTAAETTAPSPRVRLPGVVWILSIIAVCVAIGFGIVAPALPIFARDFGVGRTAAGLVISMFAAARMASAFGVGRLVDRIGARSTLGVGLVIVAVSSALAGLSQSYEQLLLLRGAGGVGSAMFSVSAASVMANRVPSEVRGRAMSVWSGSFLFGGVLGPVVGGPLTAISLRTPFFFYAGTLSIAAVVAFAALPRVPRESRESRAPREPRVPRESREPREPRAPRVPQDPGAGGEGADETRAPGDHTGQERDAKDRSPYDRAGKARPPGERTAEPPTEGAREALRLPQFRIALVGSLTQGWATSTRSALVPLFVTEALLLSDAWSGYALAIAAAVNAMLLLPLGRWTDAHGRLGVVAAGGVASAAGMAALAAPPAMWLMIVAVGILGVGAAAQAVGPSAILGDVARGRRGSVIATYQVTGDIGTMIGPVVAGGLADLFGFPAGFGLTAVICALSAVVAAPFVRRERPPGALSDPSGTVGP